MQNNEKEMRGENEVALHSYTKQKRREQEQQERGHEKGSGSRERGRSETGKTETEKKEKQKIKKKDDGWVVWVVGFGFGFLFQIKSRKRGKAGSTFHGEARPKCGYERVERPPRPRALLSSPLSYLSSSSARSSAHQYPVLKS
jgi:hypothetical protein